MSLFNIFNISGSGMSAQNLRLNLTSSNLANAESVASTPEEAYKSRQPVFAAMLQGQLMSSMQTSSAPVQVQGIVESQVEHSATYSPDHPMANKEGYLYQSNVNVVEEMANMISASRSYQNNVEVLNTSKDLLLRTLRLGS